jgi:hypothetical protein
MYTIKSVALTGIYITFDPINNKRKFWNYNKYMENEEYTFEQGVIEEIKKETSFSK